MSKRKPERRNWKLFFPVFEIEILKKTRMTAICVKYFFIQLSNLQN